MSHDDAERNGTFVTGSQLRSLFEELNPFARDLSLKPPEQRKTVLAANANYPLEIEVPAFFHAAAMQGGSPLIVQISGAGLETLGKALKPKSKSSADLVGDLRLGARLMARVCEVYASIYRPPFVAIGLDHFAVPGMREALFADDDPQDSKVPCPPGEQVKKDLFDALDACEACGVEPPPEEDLGAYEAYLCSQQYRRCIASFMAVIEEMNPAWAMIDTGEMPPGLNFAITKEVCRLVKESGSDAIVEAEYGATGQAGAEDTYEPLKDRDLALFARQVAGFVQYTGASGISYPIGMEHAAPSGVRHKPDVVRLETVQREIIKAAGRYVPFAQHGGTGAQEVARGLVAKNNVNTYFLVKAAQSVAMHVSKYREGIAQGRKTASGTAMYLSASVAVLDATVEKLQECGTFGAAESIVRR